MPGHDASVQFAFFDAADCGISEFVGTALTGIAGVIKQCPEDFCVSEISTAGELVRAPEGCGESAAGAAPAEPRRKRRRQQPAAERARETWPEAVRDYVSTGPRKRPRFPPSTTEAPEDDEPGDWMRFRLWKRGADTLEAVSDIAAAVGVRPTRFRFAGIKDSCALTVQEVMGRGLDPAAFTAACADLPGLAVSVPEPVPRHHRLLRPGMCDGNFFRIRIRGSAAAPAALEEHFAHVRRHGFVNYVGLQRFGKKGVRADVVGMYYLQRDYERATEAILNPAEAQGYRQHSWIDTWRRTANARCALASNGGPTGREWVARALLEGFAAEQQRPDGAEWAEVCRAAFLALPYTVRMLFAHSYFDRLWNIACSDRLRRYGSKEAVAGDLVRGPDGAVRLCAADGEASIFEVVLPRPGSSTQYPGHATGELMQQYLSYDGIAVADDGRVGIEDRTGWWELGCDYRTVLARPDSLQWRQQEGSVECCFPLASGQYATMLLRELMERRPRRPPRHLKFSDSDSSSDG
eukprot:TRINITY_DN21855_c0_g1_i1.p1 TRINITY_DN21855_c0_g1~~TRINITY_DN21855_c0_g1_i1.p1  ORF type:complete len:521 (+),score=163.91 TRINITY_DN21855_c0_g1_i1:147-1709(+)